MRWSNVLLTKRTRPKIVLLKKCPAGAFSHGRQLNPVYLSYPPSAQNDGAIDIPPAIAVSLALVVSFSASADFTGKVVGVADGDSITVLRDREQVKVRLVDIDAPERAQPFGNRSKQALEALVKGQEVLVVEHGHDRYHRTLGRIYRGDLGVNAEEVRQGMAWVFRQYAKDTHSTRSGRSGKRTHWFLSDALAARDAARLAADGWKPNPVPGRPATNYREAHAVTG